LTVIAGGGIAEAPATRDWEARVAREARHQAMIEAAFDRVDECERHGVLARALEWLTRAEALGGGLPPAYGAKRAQYGRELARRPAPKEEPDDPRGAVLRSSPTRPLAQRLGARGQ
jgi:hypothetical protein